VQLQDGTWLSDQLRGPQWKLLAFGAVQPIKNIKFINATEEMVKTYGLSDGLVLIRPDGYIALIASQLSDVKSYLKKVLS
jgi:hypothetical protein